VREKHRYTRQVRGLSFEAIVYHIEAGGLLDVIEHPNPAKYAHQRIFVVDVDGYICLVPFVESEQDIFMKTIIPSRRMTRRYPGGEAP
jgi:hypothetical protein